MKKVVGKVTEEEKLAIWEINEHKNSLEELLLILSPNNPLYEIAVNDLDQTMRNYQNWWNSYYRKYQWEKGVGDWKVLFETNEIVIDN